MRVSSRGLFLIVAIPFLTTRSTLADTPRTPPWNRETGRSTHTGDAESYNCWESRLHYIGDVWLNVTCYGDIGSGAWRYLDGSVGYTTVPPFQDLKILGIQDWQPSFEFPARTKTNYLLKAGLAFGCLRWPDTLVSTCEAGTFYTEFFSHQRIRESSSIPNTPHHDPDAIAEQQYFALYADTLIPQNWYDEIERRLHAPIGLEVHQTSMAWSGDFARRFVIIDNWIVNISPEPIHEGCVGLTVLAGVKNFNPQAGRSDDICGFLREAPGVVPGVIDTVDIAWVADNDGDPTGGVYSEFTPNGVMGLRILRAPEGADFSFNWWDYIFEWGPRHLRNQNGYWGSVGRPVGDRGLYRMMTNGEIDYDQVFSAINMTREGWSTPHTNTSSAQSIAGGGFITFILSYGPLPDIAPGDSIPLTYALVIGENFHTDPSNYSANFNPLNPEEYLGNLDFTDLIFNARLADWLFDTPGEDTDGDGYRGKYAIDEVGDTVWYKGDGVPDWGGAQPPPAPDFELTTKPYTAILRWTGAVTETAKDLMSRRRDFEGYRVYATPLDRADRYALVASWDLENYKRFGYHPVKRIWEQIAFPLTIAGWKNEIGDPEFDPRDYLTASVDAAYVDTTLDTIRDIHGEPQWIRPRERHSYWAPEGPNQANAYWQGSVWENNLIQRVGERDTIIGDDTLTYGVYEVVLGNLSPTIPQYFAVTAFDHGDYRFKTAPVETGPQGNKKYGFILYSSDVVSDSGLKVTVYPNPYKGRFRDAYGNWTNYYEQGYEALGQPHYTPFDRRIWFANLPDTAMIRIYSVDGDLIREIHHPDPFLTRYSSIVGWDLISRNQQEVESGIYIYRVDSHLGSQMGKFVIIK